MGEVEVSKRHHTVPNFYLKGFGTADSRPKIGAVSLDDGRRLVMSTSDATVRRNFYALDGHPEGADVFEKCLSQIEGDASAVVRKAVEGTWPLSGEDREILGTFLTLQFLRGPDTRMSLDEMQRILLSKAITQMGPDDIQDILSRSGKEADDDVVNRLIDQATKPGGITLKTTPAGHISHMLELVPELVRYFVGRPWVLIRFNRRKLLTCDTPVALVRDPELDDVFAGVGVMTAWGISVPLTREVGLLLTSPQPLIEETSDRIAPTELMDEILNGSHDHEQAGSTKMARLFTSHIIANARRWIFHHPDDTDLLPDDLPGPRDREMDSKVLRP